MCNDYLLSGSCFTSALVDRGISVRYFACIRGMHFQSRCLTGLSDRSTSTRPMVFVFVVFVHSVVGGAAQVAADWLLPSDVLLVIGDFSWA